jgi:hypothetical protein
VFERKSNGAVLVNDECTLNDIVVWQLVDFWAWLTQLVVAEAEDQITIGVESNRILTGKSQTDATRIRACCDDEVILEAAAVAVVHEIDSRVNFARDETRKMRDVYQALADLAKEVMTAPGQRIDGLDDFSGGRIERLHHELTTHTGNLKRQPCAAAADSNQVAMPAGDERIVS